MLEGYWSKYGSVVRWVAISLGLAVSATLIYGTGVLVGKSIGYYDAQAEGYAAQYPSETDERVSECFARLVGAAAQECAQHAIKDSRENERGEQDLNAQKQMAKWAFWLLSLTAVQSLIGVGGFIVLIITIHQGREANRIARENSHRELRAYLSVTSLTVDELDFDASEYVFNMQVTNHGQTPGAIHKIWFDAIWLSENGATEIAREQRDMMIDCYREPIVNVEFRFSGIFDGNGVKGNIITIVVLSYKDVFGKLHADQFGWMTGLRYSRSFLNLNWPLRLGAFSPEVVRQLIEERRAERENSD